MRGSLAMATALLSGCYSPTITPGAPCDPAIGNCPRPLACVAGPTGFTCDVPGAHPDSVLDPDAAIDAAADAAIDARMIDAATDAPTVFHLEYPSIVADCIDPANPDPDFCINKNGHGRLAVDAEDTSASVGWEGFVRFDLDGMIAGRVVTSVKLQMTATNDGAAAANNSGVVYQCAAFTRASLAVTTPATIGTQLAGSQGNVAPGDVVLWPLPTGLPMANGSVFLRIASPSTDGALYHNQTNTKPPKLIIDLQ